MRYAGLAMADAYRGSKVETSITNPRQERTLYGELSCPSIDSLDTKQETYSIPQAENSGTLTDI